MNNANQPAYPIPDFVNGNGDVQPESIGLTKRELIAAMALQGILANDIPYENNVDASVNYADLLLAKLKETEPT